MWFECAVTSSEETTANQIYSNVFLAEDMAQMSKDSCKFMPIQHFIGLQVIDTRGSLVGNVKDISLDFENKNILLKVATKTKGEMDFGWDDVQSVEDVVLLKKQVDPAPLPTDSKQEPSGEQAVQALVICPSCGASSPARAKFCAKCGAELKS
jgi:sporulation protein YlmC with PRC-barrel domain/ribosomal protein L40E